MSKKIAYKTSINENQRRLGDEKKTKRELCRFVQNCKDEKCPCQYFKMRF